MTGETEPGQTREMRRTNFALCCLTALILTAGLNLPASAECLGACADRLGRFLLALVLLPVLLVALVMVLYLRRKRLALGLAVLLLADLGVLFVYA